MNTRFTSRALTRLFAALPISQVSAAPTRAPMLEVLASLRPVAATASSSAFIVENVGQWVQATRSPVLDEDWSLWLIEGALSIVVFVPSREAEQELATGPGDLRDLVYEGPQPLPIRHICGSRFLRLWSPSRAGES